MYLKIKNNSHCLLFFSLAQDGIKNNIGIKIGKIMKNIIRRQDNQISRKRLIINHIIITIENNI